MSTGAHRVVWFDIPVLDLDRAIRFYSAVLDLRLEKQEFGDFSLAVLPHRDDTVGGCLALTTENRPSDHGPLIYLNCRGRLDQAEAAVAPHGGRVVQPKHSIGPHGFRTLVKDSEGNLVALHSP